MADRTTVDVTDTAQLDGRPSEQLSNEQLLEMFRMMLLSRRLDERAWVLHRQGRIAFHISAMGHEACQVAAAFALNRGVDYVVPYYRDLTLMLCLGFTPREFVLSLFGKEGETTSKARQMPSHFGARRLNVVSSSSPVATQVPQAAGLAFGIKYRQQHGLAAPDEASRPRVALTCLGEGSTSQGEWHEGMNWAGVHQLPFICLVQNNHYAISVPVDRQMAVPSVADRAAAYGVHGVTVDGNDLLATYDVMVEAVQRAYRGEGPTLVEARVYRLVPHSSDDDDRSYRSREEVEEWKQKGPLLRFEKLLRERGILDDAHLQNLETEIKQIIDEALQHSDNSPYPPGEAVLAPVYAPLEEAEA